MLPRAQSGYMALAPALIALCWAGAPAFAAPPGALAALPATAPLRVAQASAQPVRAPSPATGSATSPADRARATAAARQEVAVAVARRDAARADKAELAGEYEEQLAEIDQLKKRRASWRRDRLIRDQLRESQGTAKKLAALDKRLRRLDARLRAARRDLLAAIDRELAAGPVAARRIALTRWRRDARRSLRPRARKIVLPDDTIDPLADPEELEYQASLLRQSEEQLARELAKLDRQADRYSHMAALRKQRRRAAELGGFDDDRPRRNAGRFNARQTEAAENGDSATADPAAPSPPEDGPVDEPTGNPGGGGSFDTGTGTGDSHMFDVVLAEVVDATTVDALRSAELSSDPAVKARAARRARAQVEAQLERLKKRRQLMQRRARTLRR